jgi:hypothetical protein
MGSLLLLAMGESEQALRKGKRRFKENLGTYHSCGSAEDLAKCIVARC